MQLSVGHVLGGLGLAWGFAIGVAMAFYTHATNHHSPRKALETILKEVQAPGPTLFGVALSTQLLLQDARLEVTQLAGFPISDQFNKQQPNVKAVIMCSPD